MKSILFVLVFSTASLCAQTIIGIQSGVSFRNRDFTRYTEFTPTSWKNGIALGIQADVAVWKRISVRAGFEYNHYAFNRFSYSGWPESYYVNSSRGDNAKCFRVSFEGLYTHDLFPFLDTVFLTGFGYAEEYNGAIWYTTINYSTGTETAYHIPKKFKPFPFHSMGVGLRTFIVANFGLEIMAKSLTNYATRYHHAINLNVLFQL